MRDLRIAGFFRPKWGIFRESFHHVAPRKPERRKKDPFSSPSMLKGAEDSFKETEAK